MLPNVRGRRKGRPRNTSTSNRTFKQVQTALGMRERHQHCARHTLICLAQDDGADPEALIHAFRNDYNQRIAVTVDMIATGTDIKPLEPDLRATPLCTNWWKPTQLAQ